MLCYSCLAGLFIENADHAPVLEPPRRYFTYAIEMQGGYLDVADRLFSSVASAWDNVQKSSSDVKELVPEFFYLPDAFCNRSMRLPLGACQNGERVDDVVLPPWVR